MFVWLGSFTYRRRWHIIACWVVALAFAAPAAARVGDVLKVGGFSSDRTEASRARAVLERDLHASPSTMVVIFQSPSLDAHDVGFEQQVRVALSRIPEIPHVVDIVYPDEYAGLIAPDGHTAYALVGMDLPPEEAQRSVEPFRAAVRPVPDLTTLVAGGPAFYADIETVSQRDLRRAELIAFPFALLAL